MAKANFFERIKGERESGSKGVETGNEPMENNKIITRHILYTFNNKIQMQITLM